MENLNDKVVVVTGGAQQMKKVLAYYRNLNLEHWLCLA